MARPSRIQIAKRDIVAHFDAMPQRVFRYVDIARVLSEQRAFWRLARNTNVYDFAEFLAKHAKLVRHEFPFPNRSEDRFAWGDVPLLEILSALKPDCYFCHYTAVRLHGLTEQLPKTIYVNHEQAGHSTVQQLEQRAIDDAFKKPQRLSKNIVEFDTYRVCLMNGMNTERLGVEVRDATYNDDRPAKVCVTSVERTLIDIAVRPAYSGGVFEVLGAYANARDAVSVNRLAAMLQRLHYAYPYHQAIGMYLDRAGYKASLLDLLRRFPMNHDFYLTHEMTETDYVKDWRIYVPKGF